MCKRGESESGKWSGTDTVERQLTENTMDRRRQNAHVGNWARMDRGEPEPSLELGGLLLFKLV